MNAIPPSQSSPSTSSEPRWNGWQLRDRDQKVVAFAVALALLALLGYYLGGLATGRQWIDLDRHPPTKWRFQVDLNHAAWPELAQLPDVGETLARRIVVWREANGPFTDVEQLLEVEGIGEKSFARLRPYLAPFPRSESNSFEHQPRVNAPPK